jgi:uncharacterized membrane protein
MPMAYLPHVIAGGVALVAGYVALSATKGATAHRTSGQVFVYAMLVMALSGAVVAAIGGTEGSVIGGVMTCYFVTTGMVTVRRPAWWSRRLDVGVPVLGLGVGLFSLTLGVLTAASPTRTMDGPPPFPFFMFGIVGLLASVGDLRLLRIGGVRGPATFVRHLWRMCFALFIASLSFFIGQADVFPKPIRIMPLLAIPMLVVLLTMFYWLWRVRARRTFRGIVTVSAPNVV